MRTLERIDSKLRKLEIDRSWDRCFASGLSQSGRYPISSCTHEELMRLRQKHKNLVQASISHINLLHGYFQNLQFCILMHYENGTVFHVTGNNSFVNKLAGFGIKVGAKFRDKDMGTSATSICLSEKKSCWVIGDEHFFQDFKEFLSIAAPIFSQDSNLTGCISLWLHCDSLINNAISGLLSKIEDARRLIQLEERLIESTEALNRMGAALDTTREGILIVNAEGSIKVANRSFTQALGVSGKNIKGHPINDIFPNLKKDAIRERQICSENHSTTTGEFQYNVEIMPVIQDQEFMGAILRLCTKVPEFKPFSQPNDERAVMYDGLIAASHTSRKAIHLAKIAAKSRSNILLQGETGTGKEVFSKFIHRHSKRRDKPFIAINCASIPIHLAESELFGYVSGAFTGASAKGKKGKFEIADGGTIFLDEVNSLSQEIQKKLLRVIESKEVTPLGGYKALKVNNRIISASTADLREETLSLRFLPELFYRINAITINIPPLRERRDDIVFIAEHFLQKLQSDNEKTVLGIAPDARLVLKYYDWPGNIRELRNVVEYALAFTENSIIAAEDLPEEISESVSKGSTMGLKAGNREIERQIIMNAIDFAQGNMTRAAHVLGVSRSTFYRKIRKHRINI